MATFDRCLERSDPEVVRHFNQRAHRRAQNVKNPIPKTVLDLCQTNFDYSEVVMYEVSDTESDTAADQ